MGLKKKWDKLLNISTALATIVAITVCALVLLIVVGIGVVLAKLSVIIE